MAQRPSPNSLIHCSQCGEDYSATYKRCPFCGAKNDPPQSDSDRSSSPSDLEDTYVFDGQDLFDDEGEENDAPVSPRGGKRLAGKPSSAPFANADINWPRVITFICSLIIIVAAMIIVVTVILPLVWKGEDSPSADGSQNPSSAVTDPIGSATQSPAPSAAVTGPAATDPGTDATDPGTEPTATVPPVSSGLKSFTANNAAKDSTSSAKPEGFTLKAGESWQLRLTFVPADWSGEVTYSISENDSKYATVSATGLVTNVNPESGGNHRVMLTITAGGLTLEMPVFCRGVSATQPPATDPAASDAPASDPPASDPPASQAPSGTVTVGKKGVIANVSNGVYVRAEPSTSGERLASLFNGDPITVLEDAGNGWYKISFAGIRGPEEGYVMGDYISTD